MAGNQVVLTFAGDTQSVEKSFQRVGSGAETMGRKVGESSDGFSRAGEAADNVDTKAMGFRDTLTGVQDTAKGTSEIMKGNLFEGFLTLGAGIGDLGSGLYNTLIPALSSAVGWFRATTVGQYAAAVATKVWTATQWLFSAALWASPITWIVIGIIALIAVIVLIATKTDWFQRAWKAAWGWIKGAASSTWEFIKKIPGWIGTAFGKIADFVSKPFKTGFNLVAKAWNNTIGRLSWTVPSWIPGIGGNTISVPNLPTFHAGGVVPGAPGQNVLAMLQAGETVNSAAGRGGGGAAFTIDSAGSRLDDLLVEVLRHSIKRGGGNVQAFLGAS